MEQESKRYKLCRGSCSTINRLRTYSPFLSIASIFSSKKRVSCPEMSVPSLSISCSAILLLRFLVPRLSHEQGYTVVDKHAIPRKWRENPKGNKEIWESRVNHTSISLGSHSYFPFIFFLIAVGTRWTLRLFQGLGHEETHLNRGKATGSLGYTSSGSSPLADCLLLGHDAAHLQTVFP